MPVYNAEKYLKFSVGSVLKQTHSDWELICVDDGSTDSSGAILDDYAAQDPRIRVIHKPNGGEGSARNAGMDVATGELIAFLDADDAFHSGGLALFAAAYTETSADVMRYGWTGVNEHGVSEYPLPGAECVHAVDLRSRTESTVRFCALGCVTVVSRATFGDLRFCSLPQGADMIFVMDCLLRSRRIVKIEAPILHYLAHSNSASQKITTSLMTGTCGYIPELLDRCVRLEEGSEAFEDTRRYMCELLFRRLFGSWRLFEDARDKLKVCQAFWATLDRLVAMEDLFRGVQARLIGWAVRRRSSLGLVVFAVWPHRLRRKIR